MIDKEIGEESGPDWTCSTCGESFKSEKSLTFTYVSIYEIGPIETISKGPKPTAA